MTNCPLSKPPLDTLAYPSRHHYTYIGQTVWISFQQGDLFDFFNVYLDDISISTVPSPLPTVPSVGVWGLVATTAGLAGATTLLGHRRRRRYVARLHGDR